MCAQDVHTTHIVTNMENIKNNALLYIETQLHTILTSITKHSGNYYISSLQVSILHRDSWLGEHSPSTHGTPWELFTWTTIWYLYEIFVDCKASVSAPYSTSITKGFIKAQRLDTIWLRLAILVGHILLNLSHYFSDKSTHVEVILVNSNIILKPSK
jgi:hypothetical protein